MSSPVECKQVRNQLNEARKAGSFFKPKGQRQRQAWSWTRQTQGQGQAEAAQAHLDRPAQAENEVRRARAGWPLVA
eukprot:3962544-Pyramimonas_sp.AAC.1